MRTAGQNNNGEDGSCWRSSDENKGIHCTRLDRLFVLRTAAAVRPFKSNIYPYIRHGEAEQKKQLVCKEIVLARSMTMRCENCPGPHARAAYILIPINNNNNKEPQYGNESVLLVLAAPPIFLLCNSSLLFRVYNKGLYYVEYSTRTQGLHCFRVVYFVVCKMD